MQLLSSACSFSPTSRSVPFGPERQQSAPVNLINHLNPSGSRSLVINKVMRA
jgi:hypothetical protein